MTDTVAPMLDAGGTRAVAYLLVAALAATWYVRERRALARAGDDADRAELWPTYWFLTALVLTTMGLGRGVFADSMADLGRDHAWTAGWYRDRRDVQIVVCVVICGLWLVGVVIAIWRVRSRRRRYLASMASVSALTLFAAIRVVSLHQFDTLLYRRGVGDVRFVAMIELGLLIVAAIVIVMVRIGRPGREPVVAPPRRFASARLGDES